MPKESSDSETSEAFATAAKANLYIIATVFLTISCSTIAWVSFNQTPPCWDPADHLRFGLDYYEKLSRLQLSDFFVDLFFSTHYYPPLYHLLLAGVFLFTDPGIVGGVVANLLLLAALLLAVYKLGCKFYGRDAGLMAALVLPAYHVNAVLIHEAFIDFALMCWVGISLFILSSTDEFTKRNQSLLCGLVLGLGMLCKQPYMFFIFLPTTYVMFCALLKNRIEGFRNILFVAFISSTIILVWYGSHLGDVLEIYNVNKQAAAREGDPELFSYFSNIFYIRGLASEQIQLPFFILFLAGLLASFIFYLKKTIPLYLTIFAGLSIFTLIANKDIRYTVPILPSIALISVCWIGLIKQRWLKISFMILLFFSSVASFNQAQWPRSNEGYKLELAGKKLNIFASNYLNYGGRPGEDSWAVRESLEKIVQDASKRKKYIVVGVVPNLPFLNPSSFAFYAELYNNKQQEIRILTEWLVDEKAFARLRGCHYLIVRDCVDEGLQLEKRFTEMIKSHPEQFIKVGELQLITLNSKVYIYRQVVERYDKQASMLGSNASKPLYINVRTDSNSHLFCHDVLPFCFSSNKPCTFW